MTTLPVEHSFSASERRVGRLVAILLSTVSVIVLGILVYWAVQPAYRV